MLQIVNPTRENDKPMLESPATYRVVHVDRGYAYWSDGGYWGIQADARIFNAYERANLPLPADGCWEIVTEEPSALRRPLDRSLVAQTITRYLWTQHCREEGLKVVPRLQDVPSKESAPFIKAGEFITELTLSPDRFESALMAAADVICTNGASGDGALTIFDASKRMQQHYYALAVSAFHAIEENVKEVPPDWNYRDQLCRTLDTFAPKGGGL